MVLGIQINGAPQLPAFNADRAWDLFGDPPSSLTAKERKEALDLQRHYASHVSVQVLGPQTLANAINDSPAGLCSWLLERRLWWSDSHGDIESVFSKDDLLTGMSIYWFTESFASSVRYYREATLHPWRPVNDGSPHVQVPTAVSVFQDVSRLVTPESAAKTYNICQFRVHDRGGHFAPFEAPDLTVDDIRDAFRPLR
jgi:microsomal epoxide hydrolase